LGAEIITVHYEACPHLHRTIQQIKDLGCKAGVALNPHTPVNVLEDIIQDIDMVLIMSVNPGFGGQKFIEHTYEKVRKIRQMSVTVIIEIDGGVTSKNAKKLVEVGANALVAGSFVFSSVNPIQTIADLKNI
jgi:ribulose-phosphate 3-epimerase